MLCIGLSCVVEFLFYLCSDQPRSVIVPFCFALLCVAFSFAKSFAHYNSDIVMRKLNILQIYRLYQLWTSLRSMRRTLRISSSSPRCQRYSWQYDVNIVDDLKCPGMQKLSLCAGYWWGWQRACAWSNGLWHCILPCGQVFPLTFTSIHA